MKHLGLKKRLLKKLIDHKFYTSVCLVNKIILTEDNTFKAPAGITIKGNKWEITYNRTLLEEYTEDDAIAIMLHELFHIYQLPSVFEHVKKYKYNFQGCNMAADLAVNQQVDKILPFSKELKDKSLHVQYAYPEAGVKFNYPFNLDWTQYYKLLKNDSEQQSQDKGEGQEGEGQGEGEEGEGQEGKGRGNALDGDLQDLLDQLSESDIDELKEALNQSKELGKQIARQAGSEVGDADMVVASKISNDIKNALKRIKMIGQKESNSYDISYAIPNLLLPNTREVAGDIKTVNSKGSCIVILDTSGSMFCDDEAQYAAGGLKTLVSKGVVSSVYCLDTQLTKLNNFDSNEIKLKGGGGTEINKEHIYTVLKDSRAKKHTIIYLTDGYVDLNEAKAVCNQLKCVFKPIIIKPSGRVEK